MSAQVKTLRTKKIDTECDELSFVVGYTEWMDCQIPVYEFGHGKHLIDNSKTERELISLYIQVKEELIPILHLLNDKRKDYFLNLLID